jgi:hypothetical protein
MPRLGRPAGPSLRDLHCDQCRKITAHDVQPMWLKCRSCDRCWSCGDNKACGACREFSIIDMTPVGVEPDWLRWLLEKYHGA